MILDSIKALYPVAVVAFYSLAWFTLGLLIGRQVERLRKGGRKQKAPARKSRKPKRQGGVELYVGNLSYDADETGVQRIFERYGKVLSTRIIRNSYNNKSKGFGFVEMADRDEADAAIQALNDKEMKGRKMVVNEAQSKAR